MAGFFDSLFSAGDKEMKEANGLSRETIAMLKSIGVPDIEIQKIALENPELVGMLEAEQLNNSALGGVRVDPRMQQAQMKALEEMAGLSQTGLGDHDKAAIQQSLRRSGAEAQAQNESVLQNAAATGTLDSGNALMAQLMSGQQSADRAQQAGMQQAAQAAQARQQALGQYGNMASQMGQQDYAQKSDAARAQDAISQFNAQNRQGVNQYNLGNKQALENQRAANANQSQIHNTGLHQQKFNNEIAKATGVAGAQNNMANNLAQQGQAKAQGEADMWGSIIGAGAQVGAASAGKK